MENRNHDPKSLGLIAISNICNVTADYLLGLTDLPNRKSSDLTLNEQQSIKNYRIADDLDKEKRLEYEAREKAIRDHNQFLFEAEKRGEERGIEIGEKRGEKQTSVKIAEKLIKLGYSTEEIIRITELPENQIDKLR